jgi:heme exporter protein D
MGGYALYVWGSFGVTALALIIEPLLLRKRRSEALRRLKRELSVAHGMKSVAKEDAP